MKILFVCTGNTCRSPMAEHLFRKILDEQGKHEVQVASAGISPAMALTIPEEARMVLKEEGITQVAHHPKGVTERLLKEFDLILTMEKRHKDVILRHFPRFSQKIYQLHEYTEPAGPQTDVADPFGQSLKHYQQTGADIKKALLKLISKLDN